MKYKKTLLVFLLGFILVAASCTTAGTDSSTREEQQYTEQQMQEMNRQVGMPRIDNFFEKKLAKQIFELRDNSELVTYAYNVNLEGKYIYLGKAVGFGLPYSTQFTSPQKLARGDCGQYCNDIPMPQADPNGLYMPDGLSATWLVLINEDTGEQEVIYTEPTIVVTQTKLPRRLMAEWSLPEDY